MTEMRLDAALPQVTIDPASGPEIVAEVRRVHAESVAYWSRYTTAEFFHRSAPEVWAPADQVRHLTKSVRAVVRGLGMPRITLLVFGIALRPPRSYSAMRDAYLARLAAGVQAGRFAPRPLEPDACSDEGRRRVMAVHETTVAAFCDALGTWTERALDRYRMPHPALGTLTVREMALFTLYHNTHHVHVAERRRRELAARPATP